MVKKLPVWSSLTARFGEKALKYNPTLGAIESYLVYFIIFALFGYMAFLAIGHVYFYVLFFMAMAPLVTFFRGLLYREHPDMKKFLIVYDDEIVLSTLGSRGPGFVRPSRDEYRVEVIARDAEVYDMEKCTEYYTLVFNKPVRGTNFAKLDNSFNLTSETVREVAQALGAEKVLVNGYYYPTTYAVFKLLCGDEAPDLAKALLKDYTEEVKKYGHWKISALMNALRSLCLAKRKKEAIKLAKMITTGEAMKKLDKIDEWEYAESYAEPGIPCFPNEHKRGKVMRRFKMIESIDIYLNTAIFILALIIAASIDILYLPISVTAFGSLFVYSFGFYGSTAWSLNKIGDSYLKIAVKSTLPYTIAHAIYITALMLTPLPTPYWQIYLAITSQPYIVHPIYVLTFNQYYAYKTGLKHAKQLLN